MITIDHHDGTTTGDDLLRFAQRARRAVKLKGRVCVLITTNREMRRLNRGFRGKDKPTDVISYPAMDLVSGKFAGDIAISGEIARANATSLGHRPLQELEVLILHGLLHLAGYDHERDNGEMAREEARLRAKFGLPVGLIARTEQKPASRSMKSRKPKPKAAGRKC